MIILILCIFAFLPALYPIKLLVKKKDLNLFDFVILFHTLNFVVSPFLYGYKLRFDDNIVFSEFLFYISFILLTLSLSIYWHKTKEHHVDIINITRFIGRYKNIEINLIGRLLFIVALLVSLVFYLPRATYILHVEEIGAKVDYQTKVAVSMWGSIWNFLGMIFSISLILSLKNKQHDKQNMAMTIVYYLMLIFFPRRVFLMGILILIVILYSLYREVITKKIVGMIFGFGLVFYLIYFPFYNIMRSSNFMFDTNHPIDSLVEIVSNAIDNWSYRDTDENSAGASSNRSLGLYTTLYDLIRYNPEIKGGELTYQAVDFALPKILNPNKGDDPALELERMTKRYQDQADSFLLHAFGEFHYWGFIYAAFLYLFIFKIYSIYQRIWKKYLHVNLIPFYISILMFSMTWHVETGVSGNISWFFSSVPTLLIITIVEKFKIIQLR